MLSTHIAAGLDGSVAFGSSPFAPPAFGFLKETCTLPRTKENHPCKRYMSRLQAGVRSGTLVLTSEVGFENPGSTLP